MDFVITIKDLLQEYPDWMKWFSYVTIIFMIVMVVLFLVVPKKEGSIDASYIKIFSVEVDNDMYQIGIICKITNLTKKAIDVNQINYKGEQIELISRGSYKIPIRKGKIIPILFTRRRIGHEIVGGTPIQPTKSRSYKILLPMKLDVFVKHGPLFEIIFWGGWEIVDSKNKSWEIMPKSFGNSEEILNKKSWKELVEPSISLKKNPQVIYRENVVENYILYNRDRTAKIDLYGYCKTDYKRSDFGTLVVIRGPKDPNLTDNWLILATNYNQIWNDSKKLTIYNSVFPPDGNEQNRAFAKFSGALLGAFPEGSTTSTCADKIFVDVRKTLDNQIPLQEEK